jgi:ankyrin repeat protein
MMQILNLNSTQAGALMPNNCGQSTLSYEATKSFDRAMQWVHPVLNSDKLPFESLPQMEALNALSKKSFVKFYSFQRSETDQFNKIRFSFLWQITELLALMKAIAKNGIVTEKDMTQFSSFRKNVGLMQEKALRTDFNTDLLEEFGKIIDELRNDCLAILNLSSMQQKLRSLSEKSINDIDRSEEVLLASEKIHSRLQALVEYDSEITKQNHLSFGKYFQKNLKEEEKLFIVELEDLTDDIEEFLTKESVYLQKGWEEGSREEKRSFERQVNALLNQQNEMLQQFSKQLKLLPKNLQGVAVCIKQQMRMVGEKYIQLSTFWKNKLSPNLEPLVFAEMEWRSLREKKEWDHFANSNEWSDTTKKVVHTLFVSMQLSQNIKEIYQRMVECKKMYAFANRLQHLVFAAVSEEDRAKISKESALLGNLLSDRFTDLQKNEELIKTFTKGHPNIREVLEKTVAEYRDHPPTLKEVNDIIQRYQVMRYVKVSPIGSPYHRINLSEKCSYQQTKSPHPVGRNEYPYGIQQGDFKRVFHTMSGLYFYYDEAASCVKVEKTAATCFQFVERTDQAVADLRGVTLLIHKLSRIKNEQAQFLAEALVKTLEARTDKNSSPMQMALWFQRVEDTLNAVHQIYLSAIGPISEKNQKIIDHFNGREFNRYITRYENGCLGAVSNGPEINEKFCNRQNLPGPSIQETNEVDPIDDAASLLKFETCSRIGYYERQLITSLEMGHRNVFNYLLKSGANPNQRFNCGDNFALLTATKLCRTDAVQLLIRAGAMVRGDWGYRRNPLFTATAYGHLTMMKMLLEAGANPNLHDLDCKTPLFFLPAKNCLESIELLLAAGADPTIVASNGQTALQSLPWDASIHCFKKLQQAEESCQLLLISMTLCDIIGHYV